MPIPIKLYYKGLVKHEIGFDKNQKIKKIAYYTTYIQINESIMTNEFRTFKRPHKNVYYEKIIILDQHENGLIKSFKLVPPNKINLLYSITSDDWFDTNTEYVVWTTTEKGTLWKANVHKKKNGRRVKRKSVKLF